MYSKAFRALMIQKMTDPERPAAHLRRTAGRVRRVLEEFLSASLYRCYVESLRSETWFRLRTMEEASESLKKRIAELSSQQNYVRQEEITEEMLEILGGGMFFR
jgi:F0F1-type ATP synthase gamma subunit